MALPPRPDLGHLRHQARNLLRAAKTGDPDGCGAVGVRAVWGCDQGVRSLP